MFVDQWQTGECSGDDSSTTSFNKHFFQDINGSFRTISIGIIIIINHHYFHFYTNNVLVLFIFNYLCYCYV